jgi:hypothetical protein
VRFAKVLAQLTIKHIFVEISMPHGPRLDEETTLVRQQWSPRIAQSQNMQDEPFGIVPTERLARCLVRWEILPEILGVETDCIGLCQSVLQRRPRDAETSCRIGQQTRVPERTYLDRYVHDYLRRNAALLLD